MTGPLKHSLYWRLLIAFCVANLLVLFLGGLLARGFIEYTTTVEIDWPALARDANQAYEDGGQGALAAWAAQQRGQGIQATLFEDGRPLNRGRMSGYVRARLPSWLQSGRSSVMEPRPGLYVAVQQVTGSDGQTRTLLALSRSHARLRPHAREQIYLGVQLLLSLMFIGLVGWWVARSVARPVAALRRATQRLADGELSARVGTQDSMAPDELSQLAGDFDAMAERIEALVAHERGVLQDLSHELRSPLARLQLIVDLARRGGETDEAAPYFRQAEQEIARIDRMLEEMLALSRLEGGLPGMEHESVDLSEMVRACVDQWHLEAGARDVQTRLDVTDDVMVSGNALLLERAVDNLLGNAIKFSPVGGVVEVSLREDGQVAELTLRDHGPGVPDAELALLFRPFFRGSNAARADGHGLGLASVQRVVKAHGGTIEVCNAHGGGLQVSLRLALR